MEGHLFTCPIMKDKEYLPKYQEAFQSLEKTATLFFTTLTRTRSYVMSNIRQASSILNLSDINTNNLLWTYYRSELMYLILSNPYNYSVRWDYFPYFTEYFDTQSQMGCFGQLTSL